MTILVALVPEPLEVEVGVAAREGHSQPPVVELDAFLFDGHSVSITE